MQRPQHLQRRVNITIIDGIEHHFLRPIQHRADHVVAKIMQLRIVSNKTMYRRSVTAQQLGTSQSSEWAAPHRLGTAKLLHVVQVVE
jgi:hypothetical protein